LLGARWAGLAQVLQWERPRVCPHQRTPEVGAGIRSLAAADARAARLRSLVRAPGPLEHRVPWRKDVTLGAAARPVQPGPPAQGVAARNPGGGACLATRTGRPVPAPMRAVAATPAAACARLLAIA
jgi:hypothetical protein